MQLRKILIYTTAAIAVGAGAWIMSSPSLAAGRDSDTQTDQPQHHQRDRDHHGDHAGHGKKHDKADQHHRHAEQKKLRAHIAHVLFDNLNLSDDQGQQVHSIMEDGRKQRQAWVKAHRDELHDLRQQMHQARKAKDKDKIKQVREKFRDLMKSAPRPGEVMKKVRKVLNPDQQKQFDHNLKKLRKEMRAHRNHQHKKGKHDGKDHGKAHGKHKGKHKDRDGDHHGDHKDSN